MATKNQYTYQEFTHPTSNNHLDQAERDGIEKIIIEKLRPDSPVRAVWNEAPPRPSPGK